MSTDYYRNKLDRLEQSAAVAMLSVQAAERRDAEDQYRRTAGTPKQVFWGDVLRRMDHGYRLHDACEGAKRDWPGPVVVHDVTLFRS
ncbi:MAG TPA: hypothetical protein VGE74_16850 [Gemmata sp.]